MKISSLQNARYAYAPKLPGMLRNGIADICVKEGEETQSVADQEKIKALFPNTYGKKEITFEKGQNTSEAKKQVVGVILSGGQAPGGHNVICGLYDALKATNKENVLLETGLDEGLLLSSDSQLWSIAGMLGSFYKGLFGIRLQPDSMEFRPCVPESFEGVHELAGLEYRGMTVDVRLRGHGRRIARCLVNGQEAPPVLSPGMKGRVFVELEMVAAEEGAGQVNLAHMGGSLEAPEWKAARHGIAWEAVAGADYYRVYRNGIPVSQTEYCHYMPAPSRGDVSFQVMAVALDGRESYLNEPNDYPSADARMETRPCGLSGDEVWFSRVTESPDALCYNVNIDKPGVYRVDAFFANGTFDVSDGNPCAACTWTGGARARWLFPIRHAPATGSISFIPRRWRW